MLRAKAVQLGLHTTDILQAIVRYCCRLCHYSEIMAVIRQHPPGTAERWRVYREWLEASALGNVCYRALWNIAHGKAPADVAQQHGLDPESIQQYYELLEPEDVSRLQKRPPPRQYSEADTLKIINTLNPYIRQQVYQRLRFCWRNDRSIDREDLESELRYWALHTIRRYEISGIPLREMIPLVARSITNRAKNLAAFFGSPRRNPLQSLQPRVHYKDVWYLDLEHEQIRPVSIYPDDRARRKGHYFLAYFTDRKPTYLSVYLFYETQDAAEDALRRYRLGKWKRPRRIIDLTPHATGEWQPALRSLDAPIDESGTPLHELIPAPVMVPLLDGIVAEIKPSVRNPKAGLFLQAIRGDLGRMFDQYCLDTIGKSRAELDTAALARAARRYCGLTRREMQRALARWEHN